ncbi:glycoside hydrolase family 108 protein [Mesorhizobium erdmanii]|uniref:Uncharacterized protein n=1 Tax=Mesorhizobium erdmanii TaxID=1777866 RepID=A0A6M7UFG3_9HYPH|nr:MULTISPECIES: glycosyl hydrolase 108 family protein [Mesorhizobium]OBQ74523.1 hypothetical protein A8146_01820 [Mesorhizobium loti]QKC76679.1 hypothetical protein EB233_15150 [Mesorhizobium erdmanii]
MDRNFARALALVLKSEGGWSDNPADPGGATMKGVTLANFRRYVKADASKADLRKIGDGQVATVYRRFYWDAVAGAELPDGVDYAVFDFAVNSGPGRAAKYLQASVGVSQDGRVGPATLAAVRARPAGVVVDQLCDARLAFLKRLLTWATFGRGWSDRVRSVRTDALLMSAPATVSAPVQPATPVPRPVPTPPSVETPAGNAPAAEPALPAPVGSGVPTAAKAVGIFAAVLLIAYAAWHHIAVALQGIF